MSDKNVHILKILPDNFEKVKNRNLSFQLRKSDRPYKVGDILFLKEHIDGVFTGRTKPCGINDILTEDDGLKDGFVLLNIILYGIVIGENGDRYETNL